MATETITTTTTIATPNLDQDIEAVFVGQSPQTQILLLVNQLLRNQGKIMAAIDNLNTAVAAIQQQTTTLIGTLDSQFAALKDALAANAAANQDPAIQAAADALNKTLADEQAAIARDTLSASTSTTTSTGTDSPAPAPAAT